MKNAVATQQHGGQVSERTNWTMDDFKGALKHALPMIAPLLPAHIKADHFEAAVITEIAYNKNIWGCSLRSIIQAVRDAADLGLSLNKNMKEGDIVPVWSKDGEYAQFRPRAVGLQKLAMQSGEIVDIYAHAVWSNDHFKYDLGLNKTLEHTPADGDRGELLQKAYCVWVTKDGYRGFEVIEAKRIDRARQASDGFRAYKAGKVKSTPWVTDEEQMMRKTAIRASANYMPKSTESDRFTKAMALALDSRFDDDDHIGAAAKPPVLAPPRPTRAAMEAQNKEIADADARAAGRIPDDEPVGVEDADATEEQAEVTPTNEQTEKVAAEVKAETKAEPKPQPTGLDPAKCFDILRKKLLNAEKPASISAILVDYKDEIAALTPEMTERWNAEVEKKRAALAKK